MSAFRNAWAQATSAVLGVWLMAVPAVLDYAGTASAAHRILGPVAAAVGFVAIWAHMRPLRWANVLVGGLLLVTPFAFGFDTAATANGVVTGALLVALAFVRGTVEESFGGGWAALWTGDVADPASDRWRS